MEGCVSYTTWRSSFWLLAVVFVYRMKWSSTDVANTLPLLSEKWRTFSREVIGVGKEIGFLELRTISWRPQVHVSSPSLGEKEKWISPVCVKLRSSVLFIVTFHNTLITYMGLEATHWPNAHRKIFNRVRNIFYGNKKMSYIFKKLKCTINRTSFTQKIISTCVV